MLTIKIDPRTGQLGELEYGSNNPLPIWIDYMAEALKEREEAHPAQPPGVLTIKIDPRTGQLAATDREDAVFEYFLAEHAPPGADQGRPGATEEKQLPPPEDVF